MRWIFGGQKNGDIPNNLSAPSTSASTPARRQPTENNLNKKRRSFAAFLRASLRSTSKSVDCANIGRITTKSGSLVKNNSLLTSSRTFDVPRSTTDHLSPDRFCPSLSPAPSACHSEPAGTSGSASDGQLDRSLMKICTDVKYENRRRPKFAAIYGIPPLLWSQELAELAKTWALKLTQRGRLLFPELPGIGENIYLLASDNNLERPQGSESFKGSTGDHLTTGNELVALWAAEARHFDFSRPSWSQECRHFTQMIWRGSTEMGVARHWETATDCMAIVVFYRPSGNCNLPGEFSANLPQPDDIPEYALEASSLQALSQALNRTDLGDGGFRKGAASLPPRSYSSTNSTKILKC
uniref:SCP domain-containing protein n=1 Tax=Meloidogyne hapla TaxID=6305 RepID=A0A1I8C1U4_MELHA